MSKRIDLKGSIKLAHKKARENQIIEARQVCENILSHFPHNKKAKDLLSKLSADTFIRKLDPPKDQLQNLTDLYNRREFGRALDLADSLGKSFPNSAFLQNISGVLNGKLKRPKIAVDNFRQALKLMPNYADAHFNLGKVLQESDESDAAIESYQNALKFNPEHVDSYYNLGNTFRAVGKLDAALNSYEKALKINPKYADAYKQMGVTLQTKGDLDSAIKNYKYSIEIKQDDADGFNKMGNAFGEKGEHDESIRWYTKALKIKPKSVEFHVNMGIALKNKGEVNAAMNSYEQALKSGPDYPEAHLGMGLALKAVGKYQEASLALKRAINLKPGIPQANYFLASISYLRDDFLAAIDDLDKAILIDQDNLPTKIARQIVQDKIIDQDGRLGTTLTSNRKNSLNVKEEPLIANREVEGELISSLYGMKTRGLNDTGDARYGNGECSLGLNLFDSNIPIVQKVFQDLKQIIEDVLQKKFYSGESFFNILARGGGTLPHDHIGPYDREFDLSKHKYSLVYYLSIGDQDSDEPGNLKLYSPDYAILPTAGMIVIIPAKRRHSSIYAGNLDRVMIGLNFYTLSSMVEK